MAEAKPWAGGEDRLVCRAIWDEAPGVKTFRLAPQSGAAVHFHAGQFITLGLPLASGTAWRCFTIASSPLQTDAIDLTVKAPMEAGRLNASATAWMHAHLIPGMALAAKPPIGPFCLMAPPESPLLLVSAGSGATPMAAIARYLRDIDDHTPVHYVHLGRRAADWLFRPEIEAIAAALGSWKLNWLASSDGRPTAETFASLTPDLATREVFCCGPAGFMAAVEEAHARAGGPAARFRKEAFTAIPIPEFAESTAPEASHSDAFRLRFEPSGREGEARPGETVLSVSQRLGLAIPYACADGICGTCRIRCVSGEVEMNHQGGIEEEEIAAGDILACCSIPRSPLVLKV